MRSARAATLPSALLLSLIAMGAASAQTTDTSAAMRELMERAQQNERRSVEDLIEKLSRKAPAAVSPTAAAPTADQPRSATPQPLAPPPAPAPPSPAPAATAVATPPPAEPAAVTAEPPSPPPATATTAVATPPPAAPTAEPAQPLPAPPPAIEASTPAPAPAPSTPTPATAQVVTAANSEPRPSAELEIYFEFASAVISPRSTEQLRTLGKALTDPRLSEQKFLIAGYTDSKGKADYNLRLSQQRAEAVRDFLIAEFKVSPQRLIAKGYGKSRLKDQANPTADANRRVQIIDWTN